MWRSFCRCCKQIAHVPGNDCDIVFISLKSTENMQQVTLSCSCCFSDTVTEVLVALKWSHLFDNFQHFGDVYTRDGSISLCQRDVSAHAVMSHNHSTQVFFIHSGHPSLVTNWHDRHRYLSIHHMPYLMSLSNPRHCSRTFRPAGGENI